MKNGKLKIFGIIGYPLSHTRSPAMHNAAFRRLGLSAVYLVFEVPPQGLGDAIAAVRGLGISGINVTIPHKEAVIQYLDSLSPEAKLIGAVNTVVNKNNKLTGHNTDSTGFLRSLKEDLGFQPKGKNVFILGAGGAAKAVAFSCALKGAKRIVMADKMDEKALELACEVEFKTGCECVALRPGSIAIREMILNSRLLVNATPCGMKAGDPAAVDPGMLHEGLSVFDLVYNRETKLITAARKKGLKASGGLNMLLYQGVKAFELWTDRRAPVEVMKKALSRNM